MNSNCCGCGVCASICASKAIRMEEDKEGFLYPVVDSAKCNGCGKCSQICSFVRDQKKRDYIDEPLDSNLDIFVGRHKESDIVDSSRSGGIFTALSDYILNNNGYVCGVVEDENKNHDIIHVCSHLPEIRDKMKGSKYVQSRLSNKVYDDIRNCLGAGKKVLFTGTSCQVAGAKSLFSEYEDNIYYVDIVCHGVVSPMVYREYLNYMADKYKATIEHIEFRNKKKYGWKDHVETISINRKSTKECVDSGVFKKIFYSLCATRPSCSKCPYKTQYHPGDITIADCWGIEKIEPRFDDNRGCSMIIINSDKGQQLFEVIRKELDVVKTKMCEALFQAPLHKAYDIDKNKRKIFWEDFYEDRKELFRKYDK